MGTVGGSAAGESGFDVYRDDWGIPHLRAGSALALARAQGHNAATDRAWQIETERHRLLGTTAAFLGEEALAWDRFARQARLEDTARRCFDRLARTDPATAAWVTAYVEGVNAGLDGGAVRAPEFAAAGIAPGRWDPWTPLGVWLSTHILFAGFPTKLWREEVARRLGEDAITLFATDGPGTSGSNGWLLTGNRTVSGAPVIAGDPHRFIEDPGVYQQIHLACPEFDVVGLAVPGVPGLAHFGHTSGVAWAITNAMADYQDLYREELRRTEGGGVEALGPDGWEAAVTHTETITVAGGAPVTVEIVETARGPVIAGGPDAGADGSALALRYPPRVTGELGFEALPALLRARTVADIDTALDGWVEPVNVVLAADTTGATLHRVAGYVPLRPRDNRLRVVPAHDPAYAWHGRHAPLPRTGSGADATGTAVMANERGLAAPLGVEFAPAHRADRIRELLDGEERWTAKGMAAIHTDTHLASARPLLGLLAETVGLGRKAAELRDRLLRWDRHMDAGSTDATLYSALRAEVVHRLAAHPALAALTGEADPVRSAAHPELFRPWLAAVPRVGYALETLIGHQLFPYEDRLAAVAEAVEAVAARYDDGNPPPPWGEVHRLAPWQAWPGTDPDPEAGRPGLAGDHDCVLSTSSVPGITDRSARGPAARYVWDLARREDSLWVTPFGASGIPGDAHHRDQLPLWTRGELVPVVTDWDLLHRDDRSEETTEVTAPARASAPAPAPASAPASASASARASAPAPASVPDRRETVYEQEVDGLGTVRLVAIDPAADLDLIHSWVSEERARYWGMTESTREEVLEAYTFLDSLTTHHGYLALRDGVPAAIFQTYDPAEDPLGECYEVQPGDYGVHLLIGPSDTVEPGFTGRLLSVLISHVFSDPAHLRVVVEPDARNERAVARMVRAGFELGPEIEKPEKRARLAFLRRPAGV